MGAGGSVIEIERAEGSGWASVVAVVESRRGGAEVRLACLGLPWLMVEAAPLEAAWPTDFVLTVQRAAVAAAGFAGLPSATTIAASGVSGPLYLERAGEARVIVSGVSTAGHARVRVGLLAWGV